MVFEEPCSGIFEGFEDDPCCLLFPLAGTVVEKWVECVSLDFLVENCAETASCCVELLWIAT